VSRVTPEGAAERAGLRLGDKLVSVSIRKCIVIIIIIKDIYITHVRKGHECAMSTEMAVWLRNCLCLYSYLSHN